MTSQDFAREEAIEFEPTKMIVVQDFTPCVEDELEVKRGQTVKALYQENEWRFVVAQDGREGFIPYTYCIPIAENSTPKPGRSLSQQVHHVNSTGMKMPGNFTL